MKSNINFNLKPKRSLSKNFIKLEFPGIKVSQCYYEEGPVGLTYIHFNKPTSCFMDIRGGWPAYINCTSNSEKNKIDGINIAGGSVLGLESTTGIISESLKKYKNKKWLSINGSIIYSQNLLKNRIYPDKKLGQFAYNNYQRKLYNGQVGAGISANHGQGWAYLKLENNIKILALIVNNALGSIYKEGKMIKRGKFNVGSENTSIVVLITNLKLDYFDLKQLTNQVNTSLGSNIKPFNTLFDGDTFYTCTTEKINNTMSTPEKINFGSDCSWVVKQAIFNSIK